MTNEDNKSDKKEEMVKVKCSICEKDMEMPKSFLNKGIELDKINHLCPECGREGALGDVRMSEFVKDIGEQMKKMDENNKMAEKIAEEITISNADSLIDELRDKKEASREEIIKECFFRGVWYVLFVLGNSHEKGFLKKEHKNIKKFHESMKEREKAK
ncbi:MAG: hypothetical protein AABX66_02980 [Nanoarchaeota archaeon]